jgi:Fur family ferric uptake transcriptional regulator
LAPTWLSRTRIDRRDLEREPRTVRARNTRQMAAIETALRSAGRPLAIDELHTAAKKSLPRLGLATIYRAVRELTDGGRIVSVQYAGQPARYEWAVSRRHSHFICNRCKRVFDIEEPVDVPLPARRPKGFRFEGEEVIYYGECADCRGREGA